MTEASIGRVGQLAPTVDAQRGIGGNEDRRTWRPVADAVDDPEGLVDPSQVGHHRDIDDAHRINTSEQRGRRRQSFDERGCD